MNQRLFSLSYVVVVILLVTCFGLGSGRSTWARPLGPTSSRALREAAVARGVDWIYTQFQQDAIRGISACDAAHAVALAGQNPDSGRWVKNDESLLKRCAQAFQDMPRKDAGEAAKALLAVLAAGKDPRTFAGVDLIAFLQNHYDPETGLYHPSNLFRNALAIIALAQARQPIPEAAVQAILVQQHPDHCWGWPVGGDATDTDTSGLILHALALAGYAAHPAPNRCVARLRAMQNEDGGWELSGIYGDQVSNVDSTALVVEGLVAMGWDPETPLFTKNQNPVQAILSFQASDGSFWWRHTQPGTLLLGTTQAIPPLLMMYPNEYILPSTSYLPVITSRGSVP